MAKAKTQQKKKPASANKEPLEFSIDMDLKNLIIIGALSCLTALVLFYLGVIYGKASRNPSLEAQKEMIAVNTQKTEEKEISQKDLEIFTIREEGEQLKTLKSDTHNILAEADRVIEASQNQLKAQKKAETVEPKPTPTPPPKTVEKQWPEKTTPAHKAEELYTVQIFATKDQDKANRIVRLLRKQEFDAYLVSITIENQLIYRVRVGRKPKAEIETLNKSLEKVIGGMGMKSRIIKMN